MPPILFSLIFIIIVLEITVFVQIGGNIGSFTTLLMTVLTTLLGLILLRKKSLSMLVSVRTNIDHDISPHKELFDPLCLIVASLLLLLPGFITDTLGLILFIPFCRRLLRASVWRYIQKSVRIISKEYNQYGKRPNTIDGDFTDITEGHNTNKKK